MMFFFLFVVPWYLARQVGGGFYKGTRSGAMGKFEKTGKYSIDWAKVRTYVAPDDLDDFDVSSTQKVVGKLDVLIFF